MQAYQERVVAEKNELDQKMSKLSAFFNSNTFSSLPEDERDRLKKQYDAMDKYWGILEDRVKHFPA